MNESIFRSFTRAFFIRFGTIMGILLGIFFSFFLFSLFIGKSAEDTNSLHYTYTPTIEADAQGVRKELAATTPVILKVNIKGTIGLNDLERNKIQELLIESREKTLKDGRVKGILLCIDSPGGTVTDSDGIYRLLKAYKEHYSVPIYAYVDGLCASGGMYIACAADKIFASESSIVGSIGVVISPALNFSKLMDKVGIDSLTLSAGKGKDELNPFRPWKPEESKNYQQIINDFYDLFLTVVTSNRLDVKRENLVADYGAKIFTAANAKEIGLIDEANYSQNDALSKLSEDLGLKKGEYQVLSMKEDNWLNLLFKAQGDSSILKGEIIHRMEWQAELDPKLVNKFLYLYRG